MTRLENVYREKVVPVLQKEFAYSSPMQIPGIVKISLNIGLGSASQNNKLMEEAMKLANKIAKGPLNCYTMSKALMNKAHETTFEELLKEETAMQAAARMNPNAEEGLSAFLEKRKASFQ